MSSLFTAAMAVAKKPHVIRIRAIHLRAPNFNMPALLGISKMAYPMKNIPAPNPKAVALRPRSSLIVSFAKPTLFLSRNAMKYRNTISGNTRRLTLEIVRSPNSPSDSVDVRAPGIALSNHEGTTNGTRNSRSGGLAMAAAGLRICPSGSYEQFLGGMRFRGAAASFRGRHRPKAGWLFNYPSGNSSACAMSRVHTHPTKALDLG